MPSRRNVSHSGGSATLSFSCRSLEVFVRTIVVLLFASIAAGMSTFLLIRRSRLLEARDPARRAAERITSTRPSAFLRRRFDPQAATGLALTVALALVVIAGLVVGALVLMVRSNTGLVRYDRTVSTWGASEATAAATTILETITWFGSTIGVIVVALIVALVVFLRTRRPSVFLYLFVVVAGQNAVANLIKLAVDRARPTIDQLVGASGSSFPSGHTTAAAACYAAFALALGIRRTPRTRALLFAAAVAVAVAVGCSRIFLGVHWLTDVLGGLAVGWVWFGLTSIAFGGRLLTFGAPAEVGAKDASIPAASRT
jgi:membrane-associated phospholipid phosphatase